MMTLDRWIAMLSSIGAMLAAFATGFTIVEMAKQRRATYKPELVLVPSGFVVQGSGELLARRRFTIPVANFQAPEPDAMEWTGLAIVNLGLAAAIRVRATWRLDLAVQVQRLHDLARTVGEDLTLDYDRSTQQLTIEARNRLGCLHCVGGQVAQEWSHVPCGDDRSGMVTLQLPPVLLDMLGLSFELGVMQIRQDIRAPFMFDDMPIALVELEYRDIGGATHHKTFYLDWSVVVAAIPPEPDLPWHAHVSVQMRDSGA